MKNLETFFELQNYDNKNITNKGTEIIPQEVLNKIENEGVTLEFLNTLKSPVYKYKTQITIHGLFPELQNKYLGGYKHLFQNKNLSIGVKWNAIDYEKKKHIYKTICRFSKWRKTENSTDYFIYKVSENFTDKETYKTLLEAAKEEITHIDKSLFFGNCGVYLSKDFFGYFLVTYINIGGILQENVTKCIENICKVPIETINEKFAEEDRKRQQEEEARAAERQREVEERKAKQQPIFDAARQVLIDNGYSLVENAPIETDIVYVKIIADVITGNFEFSAYQYYKEPRQKKFRYLQSKATDLNFQFEDRGYNRTETGQTKITAWIKPKEATKTDHTQTETKQPTDTTPVKNTSIEVVNYSEKAIAIFGDTKSIKEGLKNIGARFNPFLTHNGTKQAGWILPATKQALLTNLI